MSDSLQSCGPWPARLLCLQDSPGKNTGVGCHALFQGIFLTQGLNPCLLYLLPWQEGSLPLVLPGKSTVWVNIWSFWVFCTIMFDIRLLSSILVTLYFLYVFLILKTLHICIFFLCYIRQDLSEANSNFSLFFRIFPYCSVLCI